MKNLTQMLIALMNFTFVSGQTHSSVTREQAIYDFLNWMTANDKKP